MSDRSRRSGSTEGCAEPGSRWTADGCIYVVLPDTEDDYFMVGAVMEVGPHRGEKVYLRPGDFGTRLMRLEDDDHSWEREAG